MLSQLELAPPDAILGLTEAFNKDPNPNKINLSVGVYKNEQGVTPVLPTVKEAEQRLLVEEQTKSYLPISGLATYCKRADGVAVRGGARNSYHRSSGQCPDARRHRRRYGSPRILSRHACHPIRFGPAHRPGPITPASSPPPVWSKNPTPISTPRPMGSIFPACWTASIKCLLAM